MNASGLWVLSADATNTDVDHRHRLSMQLALAAAGSPDRILLATCHRVELYGIGLLPGRCPGLDLRHGRDAVLHLVSVACGLESAIVGEDEVLHQVRDALRSALVERRLEGTLQRLFETAIAAGRLARSGLTAPGGSLAQKAIDWLGERSSLRGGHVLVGGAGRMGTALAKAAAAAGADVTVASRDVVRATRVAAMFGGAGVDLAEGARRAGRSTGIAIALGGAWRGLEKGLQARSDLPPIADISAPPAIPGPLRARLNGGLLQIDDLRRGAEPPPRAYIQAARVIAAAKTDAFMERLGVAR